VNAQMIYNLSLFTNVLDSYFVQLLGWVANNKRKKISSLPRSKQLNILFYSVYATDRIERYKIFCSLKLDRSFIRGIVTDVIDTLEPYEALYAKYLRGDTNHDDLVKLAGYERASGCSREHLYPLLRNLRSLLELSTTFRTQVIGKYYKFIYTLVRRAAKGTSRYIDTDDMMQNYITAALKALDRYDSTKGALTSYIRFWILNNDQSAEESPEYGVAYEVPATIRLESVKNGEDSVLDNFSVPIDDILGNESLESENLSNEQYSPDRISESKDEYRLILFLSKLADPIGVARLSLGIEEHFSQATLARMVRYMRSVGLKSNAVGHISV
jgi:hypothetical protein